MITLLLCIVAGILLVKVIYYTQCYLQSKDKSEGVGK